MFRIEDTELVLPSSINDFGRINRRLILYLLAKGVLDSGVVALHEMALAELDCQAGFA